MQTHLTTQQMLAELLALGMTQTQIAAKVGLAQYQVSRWRHGTVPASADYAVGIARLYAEMAAKAKRRAGRQS
jgi:transcriptional regulator with XRE-family HTH domain